MKAKRLVILLVASVAALVFAAPAAPALAGDVPAKMNAMQDGRKAELQKQFDERYPKLLGAKRSGLLGETHEGFVAAVKGGLDGETQRLMDQENRDRRELYALIAKETNTTEEIVARRAAKRNFEKARSGEYLQGPDGNWEQKK